MQTCKFQPKFLFINSSVRSLLPVSCLLHVQSDLIEARGIACARELLLVNSVDEGNTDEVFDEADADASGAVDVRELAHALAKWLLLVTSPEAPLAVAKKLAMDLFIIFDTDPIK